MVTDNFGIMGRVSKLLGSNPSPSPNFTLTLNITINLS